MIGELLDKVPDWIHIIMAGLMFLYFFQIIVSLFLMSDSLHYPRMRNGKGVDEWDKLVWMPFRLYYIWIFTDKLKYIE
jgi:hypothetical protein